MSEKQEPPCECTGPGFCPRFQIQQGEHHVNLCRNVPSYRKKWRENLEKKLLGIPSLTRRATNASKALIRAITTGLKRVPIEIVAQREQICKGCELNDGNGICKHPECGCNVKRGLVTKIKVASEKCPMGKWLEYTGESHASEC